MLTNRSQKTYYILNQITRIDRGLGHGILPIIKWDNSNTHSL